jgi:hypothetical protein
VPPATQILGNAVEVPSPARVRHRRRIRVSDRSEAPPFLIFLPDFTIVPASIQKHAKPNTINFPLAFLTESVTFLFGSYVTSTQL